MKRYFLSMCLLSLPFFANADEKGCEKPNKEINQTTNKQTAADYQNRLDVYNEQVRKASEQQAESERQLKKMEEQQNITSEQIKVAGEQLNITSEQIKVAGEQQQRMNALLERWEKQADRYDALLSKWEKQKGTK